MVDINPNYEIDFSVVAKALGDDSHISICFEKVLYAVSDGSGNICKLFVHWIDTYSAAQWFSG